ncbi:hypothetical protein CFIO01_09912 [Colletotrichum fioriniae PJ7]|uniref:Uncharacterized protein n=1 Tax=Colletotrichum fioriniae PJ7 TaxID=1445577 RepID=A0A010RBT8_9PEZI|nr:hypothetical protein CFIO01_09912 [Colletotrichum fioriniae PJ7]
MKQRERAGCGLGGPGPPRKGWSRTGDAHFGCEG